jgi:hypothetical protein
MEIPYKDGKHHVGEGESIRYLECLDSRWGLEKGDLGNELGDYFPYGYFPLKGGKSRKSGVVVLSGNS